MSVEGLGGKGSQPTDSRKTESTARGQKVAPGAEGPGRPSGPAAQTADQVAFSADVQGLGGREDVPRSEVSAQRLQVIGERIASGYYDRPEALDAVARGVLADLNRPETV